MPSIFSRRRQDPGPFPPAWRAIIARHFPYARWLTGDARTELERLIQRVIAEKHFEGAGGLRLHDVHRVTIAAHAALMMLGGATDGFPRLTTILVYPDEYVVDEAHELEGGIMSEGPEVYAGHTQSQLGVVIVSWRDVMEGVRDPEDGVNVLFHEFAHQLDFESGDDDGIPLHNDAASARRFAEVIRREYDTFREAVEDDVDTLLDPYGAENRAEFFAVATETFFEIPVPLREEHPELYDVLATFYGLDLASMDIG